MFYLLFLALLEPGAAINTLAEGFVTADRLLELEKKADQNEQRP